MDPVGFLAGWVLRLVGFTAPIKVTAHGLEAYTQGSIGVDLPNRILGAGQLEASRRTLSRALFLGTLGVEVFHVALNVVFLFSAPVEALSGKAEIGAIAAEALGAPRSRRSLPWAY